MKIRIAVTLEAEDKLEAMQLPTTHKVLAEHFDTLKKDAHIPLHADVYFVLKPGRWE